MYSGAKTTTCSDLFLFVHSFGSVFQVFTKSVRKKKEKDKTFDALSRSFPGARRCTSMLFSFSGGVEVERRCLGWATRASSSLSAWTTPPPARAHSLSTRRQGRDWKEDGSLLSAHAAESVAAWQRAPGQMPPAGSCPPCAQY